MGIECHDAIDLQLALYSDGPCGSSHYVKGSFMILLPAVHPIPD